jgi:hypothetical protein
MKKSYELEKFYCRGARQERESRFGKLVSERLTANKRQGCKATYGVLGVGHGVKGSDSERELVEDEVVGLVLLPNERSKHLLVSSARRGKK